MFTKAWFIMKTYKQIKCPTNRDTLNRYGRPIQCNTRQLLKMRHIVYMYGLEKVLLMYSLK